MHTTARIVRLGSSMRHGRWKAKKARKRGMRSTTEMPATSVTRFKRTLRK
jgi:hypothetical protein